MTLTPADGESSDSLGSRVYRGEGADIAIRDLSTKCLGRRRLTTIISNTPDGDLSYLDAGYTFAMTNTRNARK